MALVLRNDAVFLHVPKTGGNWVTTVLNELGLVQRQRPPKHADIDHLFYRPVRSRREQLRWILDPDLLSLGRTKPFMFCFVRDPLSWYESWFKYMSQPSRRWRRYGDAESLYDWHPNAMLNDLGSETFTGFVRNVAAARPGFVTEMYGWYTRPQMDFVGRQESLAEDLIQALKTMELDFDEDFVRNYRSVGVSPAPSEPIAWDPELKERMLRLEYAGIIRYGYEEAYRSEV